MCLNKKQLKNSRIFKNILRFIYCKKIGGFGVANFKNLFSFEEISAISRFLILVFILNSETQKLRNIFKTCKFQRKCFICGSRKFPSFRFWLLY